MSEIHEQFEHIASAHHELRGKVKQLRDTLEEDRPPVGTDEAVRWASDVAHQLLDLHDLLIVHFREEESSGLNEELMRAFPRASGTVEALTAEHRDMLIELRAVLNGTLAYADGCAATGSGMRRRVRALLDDMTHHEERETDLIEQLYSEDLGGGC